jgi:hormone-sensitive lipase
VGDSAGANLNASCITKCIENGIRIPDGMMFCYGPTLLNFSCSPARFMSFVDPLMSYNFIMRCLKAYAGQHCQNKKEIISSNDSENNTSKHISNYPDDFEKNIYDDDQDEKIPTDSDNEISVAWERAQQEADINNWQTNLSSIREGSVEDAENQPSCSKDETTTKSRSRTPSEDNIVFDIGKETVSSNRLQKKIQHMTNSFVTAMKSPFSQSSSSTKSLPDIVDDEFVFNLPNDYYLSPYLTPDEILRQFPPVDFMVSSFINNL